MGIAPAGSATALSCAGCPPPSSGRPHFCPRNWLGVGLARSLRTASNASRLASSASLGWGSGVGVDGLSADGAGAGPGGQEGLQVVQDRVQAQAGAAAFGLVRSRVMN